MVKITSRRLLAVTSAVWLMAVAGVLEGCSAATPAGTQAVRSTSPATAAHKRAAIADSKRLLAGVVAPSGAVVRSSGTGTGPHSKLLTAAFASAVAYRTWTVSRTPSVVLSHVVARLPAPSKLVGSGSGGPDPRSVSRTYQWPAVAGVLGLRQLQLTVTSRAGGGTLLSAKSQSQWLVARARSERIPAEVHDIQVTDGVPGRAPFVSRHVTNQAKVHALVALIDSLPIVQPGAVHCPSETVGAPVVTVAFRGGAGDHTLARARVSPSADVSFPTYLVGWSCVATRLEIAGHTQPALAGDVIRPIQRLLQIEQLRRRTVAQAPHRFVGVVQDAGVRQTLGLYSTRSGRLVRRLATFGQRFTNNGLAVSPRDTAVYFTLIPHGRWRSLKLMRLDLATDRRTFVGDGEQPAINDRGTELAFSTGVQDVAVRDLASGATRTLSLAHVLDFRIDPLNTSLVWLADGTTLAVLPAERAIAAVAGPQTTKSKGGCRPGMHRRPILFIHVPAPPAPLSARCQIFSAGPSSPIASSGGILTSSPAQASAVWIANSNGRSGTIEQITQAGRTKRILNLGRGVLPVAIDRSAQHILYIKGHPPALWEAMISRDRLRDAHRLVSHSRFETAAW